MSTKKKMLQAAAGNAGGGAAGVDANTVLLLHGDGTNGAQNNTFLDSSSNNNTLTRSSNVSQGSFTPFTKKAGEWGASVSSNNYIYATNDSDFTLGDTFTIEAWIYRNSDTDGTICGRWYSASGDHYLLHIFNTGKLAFGTGSSTNYAEDSTNAIPVGEWVHVAVSNGSGSKKLFINGVNDGSYSSVNISGDGIRDLTIGANTGGGSGFDGYISNLRIVKGSALYTSDFTPSTEALTAVTGTVLLTCQDNRFKDSSSSDHTIKPLGLPQVTPFSPFSSGDAYDPDVKGGSGYFDGNDRLTCSAVVSLTGDYTIEGWAYQRTNDANAVVCSQYLSTASGRLLVMAQDGNARFFQGDGSQFATSNKEMRGQWCHFVLMRAGANLHFYVNGTRVFQGSAVTVANQSFNIGDETDGISNHGFDGWICSLRVTSSTEYSADATITVPTAPFESDADTELLCNFTNAGIVDAAGFNSFETVGNAQINTAETKIDTGSIKFDGSDDLLLAPDINTSHLGKSNFTIEFWAYVQDRSTVTQTVIGSWDNADRGWQIRLTPSGGGYKHRFTYTENGGSDYSIDGTTVLNYDTWNHLAFVRSGNTLVFYANGTVAGSSSFTANIYNSYGTLKVGWWDSNDGDYKGYIDELRFSLGIVRYTANFTPPTEAFTG